MQLEYEERSEHCKLRYWLTHRRPKHKDDLWLAMEINEWVTEQFGPVNDRWEVQKRMIPVLEELSTLPGPAIVSYSWRFANKTDAMLFKVRWG